MHDCESFVSCILIHVWLFRIRCRLYMRIMTVLWLVWTVHDRSVHIVRTLYVVFIMSHDWCRSLWLVLIVSKIVFDSLMKCWFCVPYSNGTFYASTSISSHSFSLPTCNMSSYHPITVLRWRRCDSSFNGFVKKSAGCSAVRMWWILISFLST